MHENRPKTVAPDHVITSEGTLAHLESLLAEFLPEDHPIRLNARICKTLMGINDCLHAIQVYCIENAEEIGQLYAVIGFTEGIHGVLSRFAEDLASSKEDKQA